MEGKKGEEGWKLHHMQHSTVIEFRSHILKKAKFFPRTQKSYWNETGRYIKPKKPNGEKELNPKIELKSVFVCVSYIRTIRLWKGKTKIIIIIKHNFFKVIRRGCEKSWKRFETHRRRGRFEVPRKRRAVAPLRHWPVRRVLAPVKREDLLWLLAEPSQSVLHHLDGGMSRIRPHTISRLSPRSRLSLSLFFSLAFPPLILISSVIFPIKAQSLSAPFTTQEPQKAKKSSPQAYTHKQERRRLSSLPSFFLDAINCRHHAEITTITDDHQALAPETVIAVKRSMDARRWPA